MQFVIAALCACLTGLCNSTERAKTVHDFIGMGVGYGNLATPEALQYDDIERWGRLLVASDAQLEFMRIQYAEFVKHHNQYLDHEAPELMMQAAEIGRLQTTAGIACPEMPDAIAAMNRQFRRLQTECERMENELIDSFAAVLTDEQVDRLYLLHHEASRRQSRCFPHRSRWTDVDLRLVWEAIPKDAIKPSDHEAIDAILADYESRVTPLLRRMATSYFWHVLTMTKLLVDQSTNQFDSLTLQDRYHLIWKKYGDAAQRVSEVTEQTVLLATQSLSPQTGAMFASECKAAVFPELYPDPNSIEYLFNALKASGEIDSDAIEMIDAIQSQFVEKYNSASKELESVCVKWGEQSSRGVIGHERQNLRGALEPLLAARQAVCDEAVASLREVVGQEIVRKHWREPVKIERTPEQLRATSAGRIRPLPRPQHRPPPPAMAPTGQ